MDAGALLRLISEPTRHAMLERLRSGPCDVGQLVAAVGSEQSNVSHHLSLLRDAGVVGAQRAGRRRVYHIADQELTRLMAEVDALAARLEQVAYSAALGLPAQPAYTGYG